MEKDWITMVSNGGYYRLFKDGRIENLTGI